MTNFEFLNLLAETVFGEFGFTTLSWEEKNELVYMQLIDTQYYRSEEQFARLFESQPHLVRPETLASKKSFL
jgi:hypothetical protein